MYLPIGGYYGGAVPQQQQPQGYYPPQQQPGQPGAAMFPGQQYMSDPMANMAMQYGGTLADQGKEYVQQNVSLGKIINVSVQQFMYRHCGVSNLDNHSDIFIRIRLLLFLVMWGVHYKYNQFITLPNANELCSYTFTTCYKAGAINRKNI